MNKKGALLGSLLAGFLLVGCANNDKPSTDSTVSNDTTTSETSKDTTTSEESSKDSTSSESSKDSTSSESSKDSTSVEDSTQSESSKDSSVVEVVAPTKVEIKDEYHLNILNGADYQLEVVVSPAEASKELEWIVENPAIASVSETGLITPKELGSTKITAKSKHNEKKDDIILHVCQVPESLHVYTLTDDTKTALTEEQSQEIDTPVTYGVSYNGEAAFQGMLVNSSEPTVASVEIVKNYQFKVVGLKVGKSVITITSSVDESKTATLNVNVTEKQAVVEFEGTKFDFGEDIETTKKSDGSSVASGTEVSFTSGESTLVLTAGDKFYKNANDETGKVGLKLGTGDKSGGFTFTVDDSIKSFAIYAGRYNGTKAVKVSINEVAYDITESAQDGKYDEIIIDASTVKTFTVKTIMVDKAYCRIDAITLSTNPVAKEA